MSDRDDKNDLQRRVDDILSGRSPSGGGALRRGKRKNAFDLETGGGAVEAERGVGDAPGRAFSEFFRPDVRRATRLAQEMAETAPPGEGDEGLSRALDVAERSMGADPSGVVEHAVKLFLTHHAPARDRLRLRPLEERQPGLVVPSPAQEAPEVEEPVTRKGTASLPDEADSGDTGPADPEARLAYWREDPLLNDHHDHWHQVYPTAPGPDGIYKPGDRHGELFGYMHEQMLARYDAERLAAGLGRVEPFDDYAAGVFPGYDPGDLFYRQNGRWLRYRARPAGTGLVPDLSPVIGPYVGHTLEEQARFHAALSGAVDAGRFEAVQPGGGTKTGSVSMDLLGDTVEANDSAFDYFGADAPESNATYGDFHDIGHVYFAYFDADTALPAGVMISTATAVRDPIFWRWHKHVDGVFDRLRARQPAYDFADGARVEIRKEEGGEGGAVSTDIVLVRADGLPAGADPAALAAALGPKDGPLDPWNADFSAATVTLPDGREARTTDELTTEMRERKIRVPDGSGKTREVTVRYLSHEDFYYYIRVHNPTESNQTLTVRVFLAPEERVEDRTAWIEMDKFFARVAAGERAVLFQRGDTSSVIRKPALKAAELEEGGAGAKQGQQAWCDCGWPYTLLVPRGTEEGMAFRLFVMCTPGEDLQGADSRARCSSVSYCGLQDKKYPDTRAMGYPFDRDFPGSVAETVAAHGNMAWRTIRIRHRGLVKDGKGAASKHDVKEILKDIFPPVKVPR